MSRVNRGNSRYNNGGGRSNGNGNISGGGGGRYNGGGQRASGGRGNGGGGNYNNNRGGGNGGGNNNYNNNNQGQDEFISIGSLSQTNNGGLKVKIYIPQGSITLNNDDLLIIREQPYKNDPDFVVGRLLLRIPAGS